MAASPAWKGRALIALVAATFVIAIVAVPSFGASKKSTLEVTPHAAITGFPTDFFIKITNTTPGASNISSLSADVPFPLTPTGVVTDPHLLLPPNSSNPNAGATISVVDPAGPIQAQVRVQNMDLLKRQEFVTLQITVTPADLSTTCTSQDYFWAATAYAGNSLNGDQFPNVGIDPNAWKTTLSDDSCIHLEFVPDREPQDAIQGEVITNADLNTPPGAPVQVQLVADGATVDLTTTGNAVTLSSTPSLPPEALSGNAADFSHGVATFDNLKISNYISGGALVQVGGDYTLTASYSTYPSTPSDPFRIFDARICDGVPYTEGSEVTTGSFTIEPRAGEGCFGIIVNNTEGAPGTGNIEDWSAIKSISTTTQGTLTIFWDLGNGTDPVQWTEITWEGLNGAYHPVQLCDPTATTFEGQFPPSTVGTGNEQICLLSSQLVQVGTHWQQEEHFAYNTDLGARK
jgi:hypothetical protein